MTAVSVPLLETDGGTHLADARLQASPSRPVLSGRPPTWAQSAGMCPGPGPAALNHPDSDILSPSPSERPLWGGEHECRVENGGGYLWAECSHTHSKPWDSVDILNAGLWDGAIKFISSSFLAPNQTPGSAPLSFTGWDWCTEQTACVKANANHHVEKMNRMIKITQRKQNKHSSLGCFRPAWGATHVYLRDAFHCLFTFDFGAQ